MAVRRWRYQRFSMQPLMAGVRVQWLWGGQMFPAVASLADLKRAGMTQLDLRASEEVTEEGA